MAAVSPWFGTAKLMNEIRAACARALLEGCGFAMRDVVDRLEALGINASLIRLTGRGARSRIWCTTGAIFTKFGRAPTT